MQLPILIINFKAYRNGVGEHAVQLAKICEKVSQETGVNIVVAVQDADIYRVSQKTSVPVYAQHLEPITPGSHTGHDLPDAIKENGAVGCLINHSEDRLRIDQIKASVDKAKELGIDCVVCANDPVTAEAVAAFDPDMIAVEPPELIGGDVSVSTARPEVITDAIQLVHKDTNIPVLCGAGVNNKADVVKALELGSQGILVASAVVKAEDREAVVRELASGFIQ